MALIDVIAKGGTDQPGIVEQYARGKEFKQVSEERALNMSVKETELEDFLYTQEQNRTVRKAQRSWLSRVDMLDKDNFADSLTAAGNIDPTFGVEMTDMYQKLHGGKAIPQLGNFRDIPNSRYQGQLDPATNKWENMKVKDKDGTGGGGSTPKYTPVSLGKDQTTAFIMSAPTLPSMQGLEEDVAEQLTNEMYQLAPEVTGIMNYQKQLAGDNSVVSIREVTNKLDEIAQGFINEEAKFGMAGFDADKFDFEGFRQATLTYIEDVRRKEVPPEVWERTKSDEESDLARVNAFVTDEMIASGLTAQVIMSAPGYEVGSDLAKVSETWKKHKQAMDTNEKQVQDSIKEQAVVTPAPPIATPVAATTPLSDKEALLDELEALPFTRKSPRSTKQYDKATLKRKQEIHKELINIRQSESAERREFWIKSRG